MQRWSAVGAEYQLPWHWIGTVPEAGPVSGDCGEVPNDCGINNTDRELANNGLAKSDVYERILNAPAAAPFPRATHYFEGRHSPREQWSSPQMGISD